MKSRRRARRIVGLLPRLGRFIQTLGRWLLRHPQPFFAAACVLGAGWALWGYAQRADAFRIARVQLPPQASFQPRPPLMGMNLWRVDLRAVAEDLKRQEPWWKDVRVIRVLPNTIRIVAIPRLPAAQVRLDAATRASGGGPGRWHPVDGDGFILPDGNAEPAERLVRVVGFQRAGVALKAGGDNRDERLIAALRILRRIQRTQPVVWRRLTGLDVGDPSQLRLVLDGETEIRCGSETELDTQLGKLRGVLRAMARQPVKARYIDVRFKDPVMAPAS